MAHKSYAKSIDLPPEQIFRNLKNAKRFALDIGNNNDFFSMSFFFISVFITNIAIVIFSSFSSLPPMYW